MATLLPGVRPLVKVILNRNFSPLSFAIQLFRQDADSIHVREEIFELGFYILVEWVSMKGDSIVGFSEDSDVRRKQELAINLYEEFIGGE